eukprot:2273093-Rhodomonas_salina.2
MPRLLRLFRPGPVCPYAPATPCPLCPYTRFRYAHTRPVRRVRYRRGVWGVGVAYASGLCAHVREPVLRVIADEVVEPMENILKTITQVNSATCLRYIPTQLPTLYTCLRYISTLLPTLRAYACARPCPIPDMLAAWLCVIPCSVWCYHAHAKSGTDAAYDATVFPSLSFPFLLLQRKGAVHGVVVVLWRPETP